MTDDAQQEHSIERRQFGRRQTCWHAWIHVPKRQRLACVVTNISLGGARLELAVPAWLQYNFELEIEVYDLRFLCEVRYRRPDSLGVYFDRTSPTLTEAHRNSLARLQQLTVEGAVGLRRTLIPA